MKKARVPVDRPIHSYYKNEYDEKENLIVHTCRDQDGHLQFRHIYHYDDTGNVVEKKVYKPVDNGQQVVKYWDNVERIKIEYF
jgi:hypothetical protein